MASVTTGNRPSFSLPLALRRAISNTNATKALVWRFNDCLELFDRIVPLPEQGPTSHRPEIYAAAYAEHAYVQREGVVTTLVGPPVTPPEPHQSIIPPWCTNVLAFRTDRISDP